MAEADTSMTAALLQRIISDPNLCHGKPCIRGLRYPVEFLLELLSSGMSIEEILADYDDLERADILAALLFAAGSDTVHTRDLPQQNVPIEMSCDRIIIHE